MNLRVVIHEAEEGGYWAEVPAVPGCVTQADTLEELRKNIHEAIEGCLSVEVRDIAITETDQII
ncbi:MAG: type II toxin-antitoxin system HicB family antitoxin [Gammaproteobacteria bacterium]|nr:type II toxin-antitoxin system HicB family antitoxin [Gammaproteobacteria bacterium]MDE0414390.1 type II toxin-antitoxin system HicB family antitoxin [Gammaproteobacteria bacterium]